MVRLAYSQGRNVDACKQAISGPAAAIYTKLEKWLQDKKEEAPSGFVGNSASGFFCPPLQLLA